MGSHDFSWAILNGRLMRLNGIFNQATILIRMFHDQVSWVNCHLSIKIGMIYTTIVRISILRPM